MVHAQDEVAHELRILAQPLGLIVDRRSCRTASASCAQGRFQRSMMRIQLSSDSGLSSVRKRALSSLLP